MKLEPAMDKYCTALQRAAYKAMLDGADPLGILNGLAAAFAASVKAVGGDDQEVAKSFHLFAECYEQDSIKQGSESGAKSVSA